MDGRNVILVLIIIFFVALFGFIFYFMMDIGTTIEDTFPDGNSFYVEGYLIDVEYVGGAFGYKARTVFFFDDNRVVNVVDRNQVSVELNTVVRLELQNSKDGKLVYLMEVR